MTELTASDNITAAYTSAALGIFDGVHIGHQSVIGCAVDDAKKNGYIPAVCTFKSASVDTKGSEYLPIYSDDAKRMLFEKAGVQYVYMPDFSYIKELSPSEYVENVLVKIMNCRTVVCGRDFRFGKNAEGNTDILYKLCRNKGIELIVADDVIKDNIRVCSADIRRHIRNGCISKANLLLGHDYALVGEVVHGNHFGREMNFPTANQIVRSEYVMPKFGVYASYSEIDGTVYRGVTNIGVKPTVEKCSIPLAETHFPSYSGSLYGKNITLHLTDFIRQEMRFADINELKMHIREDTEKVMSASYNIEAV